MKKTGEKEFVMGYEESYGYLVGTHARDKDAVVASMLICEMTAYHKNNGKTLVDALEEIYKEYGFYLDALDSFVLQGIDGVQKMNAVLETLRARVRVLSPILKQCRIFQRVSAICRKKTC